jgi:hypothetical protein
MKKWWALAAAMVVASLVFLSACQAGQSPHGSATTSSSLALTSTSTEPSATTVSSSTPSSSTTVTTTKAIIPGVPSVRYEDRKLGFSLYRPQNSIVEAQGFEAFLPLTQVPVVAIVLSKELFSGTNLIEAGVYIGASSAPAVISRWNQPSGGSGETAAGTIDVNGTSFAVFTSTGAAAGNIYEERVYRTLRGGTCFEIVELLHSGNIGNYGSGVVEFNKARFQGYLEAVVQTFSFVSG